MHAACDARTDERPSGNPLRLIVTAGQRNDLTQAGALLDGYAPGAVVADRGYDADWLLGRIASSGAEAVIPPKRSRLVQRAYDGNLYADRNKIERLFNRLKQCRRVATRYEKTARNYLAFAQVAAITTLLL